MTNFHLYALVFSAIALIALLFLSKGTFGGYPRGEKGGEVKVRLEIANYLGRGYRSGFVNG